MKKVRTFEHFPKDAVCKLCGTNEDKGCILISVDGTERDNLCEAVPVHFECASAGHLLRYQPEIKIFYRREWDRDEGV